MKQNHLVLIPCLLLLAPLKLTGQEAPNAWVPFTATRVEQYVLEGVGVLHGRVERIGLIARDSHGNSYQEHKLGKNSTSLPVLGLTNDVILHDRTQHIVYVIDTSRKLFRKLQPDTNDMSITPLNREQFDQAHKGETFLGKKIISGVDCEGYQSHARFSKKYFNETWYAPSLNFLVVKAVTHNSPDQALQVSLEDLRVGAEPDPSLFRLPEGFREVKR